MIEPGLACTIISANFSHAVCRTNAADRLRSGELHITFDNGDRRYAKELFEYVEDPTIDYAESGVASQVKVPKGIPSGGITVTVAGNNLQYVQVGTWFPYRTKRIVHKWWG